MTVVINLTDRAPSHPYPHTSWFVDLWADTNNCGPGVKRLTSSGSSVMVGRTVGVKVGRGVSVTRGVPVGGVVVAFAVLIANRSGVNVSGKPKAVGVGPWVFVCVGCRNAKESGSEAQPARREMMAVMIKNRFMKYL